MSSRLLSVVLCFACFGCERAASPPLSIGQGTRATVPLKDANKSKAVIAESADDWPGWRGPWGDGRSRSSGAPLRFGPNENCLWTTAVPGTGHSSPVVVEDRVFLTTTDEQAEEQRLLVFDRSAGRLLHDRLMHKGPLGPRHPENTHASSTPVWSAGGGRLFVVFVNAAGLHATAVSRDGEMLWQKRVSDYQANEGFGASPLVWKSSVIVAGDSSGMLTALDQSTGNEVWRVERPRLATFSSPAIVRAAGRDQLLISGGKQVTSYDPDTGRLLWRCDGPWDTTCGTMCGFDDLVFCSGGVPANETLALRAAVDHSEQDRVVWKTGDRFYVPSLTVHNGILFGVTDTGIAIAFEPRTGRELWRERLGGNFFASPALSNGLAYVPNAEGTLFVLRPHRDRLEVVERNTVGEGCFASPAICGGRVYVRTRTHLSCFGEAAP